MAMKKERKRRALIRLSLCCLFVILSSACAQDTEQEMARLRREINDLKAERQQLIEQINELKGEQPPKRITPAKAQLPFDLAINPNSPEAMGSRTARVAIIEFSDFQCSFCLSYVMQTFPQLEKDYIKPGKVKYFFRNLPLTDAHPNAFRAAEAAHCAAAQGKFWEAHARFFANQDASNPNDWPQHAQALGLNPEKFNQCLESGKYDDEINNDIDDAQRLGLNGTPAFLLGVISPDGQRLSVRKVLMGAEPFGSFKETLDELLLAQRK